MPAAAAEPAVGGAGGSVAAGWGKAVCQGLELAVWGAGWGGARAAAALLHALLRALLRGGRAKAPGPGAAGCVFFEGEVAHTRRRPVRNAFRYPVRMAVVDLDDPPAWWRRTAKDHLSADEARAFGGTAGGVRLLTNPAAAGFIENPISVYYLHGPGGRLERCLAEVTNTPWGERVTFAFDPRGDTTPKALHVSPFMDMDNAWTLVARLDDDELFLAVHVTHPEIGNYFDANLRESVSRLPHTPSEEGDLRMVLQYALMPQRLAYWIYWQAVRLVALGVPPLVPPDPAYRARLAGAEAERGRGGGGGCPRNYAWRAAAKFPWK